MIVISGCQRSGTSMMMRIMERVFGEDRILGEKRILDEATPVHRSEIVEYLYHKSGQAKEQNARRARAKAMNPNGYYEMEFAVHGVFYKPQKEDLLNSLLNEIEQDMPRSICKIVSQGLAASDPRFIDRVVYMVRDPRSVAKSQENLTRMNPMNPENAPVVDGEKVLIRSVGMFNNVSMLAAKWITAHQSIPIHIVNYEDVLQKPEETLQGIQAFLGEGDFNQALDMIDPSLFRSTPDDMEIADLDLAMSFHDRLKSGDFAGVNAILEAKQKELRDNPPPIANWWCPRLDQRVSAEVCGLCHTHEITRNNLKANSVRRGIEWRTEPCPYECGIQGGEGKTVAESIATNHWHVPTP